MRSVSQPDKWGIALRRRKMLGDEGMLPIKQLEGKHYDVAISGVWYGENYGSVLTYYALRRIIQNLGYSVLMIDKIGAAPRDPELDERIHSRVFAREQGYEAAPPLPIADMPRLNLYCDTFVMGCDQVWNFNISNTCGKCFYFDYVEEDKRRLSYASSFGHATSYTPIGELSEVTRLLHRFDAVSVREADAVNVLKNEFGIEGTQVTDPVFLIDPNEYRKLERRPVKAPRSGFLLAYILDPKPGLKRFLEKRARAMGLDLVVLLDGRGNFEKNKQALGAEDAVRARDAHEWLWYFSHADFIVTDSFHGVSFSLIYEKQFLALGNKARGMSRFNSVADVFRVRQCLATTVNGLQKKADRGARVDYELVSRIKDMERKRSIAWLSDALSAPKAITRNIAIVSKKECCGCGACLNACPIDCISMVCDMEGIAYPSIDTKACIECGKCAKACPSLNPIYDKSSEPECRASYTKDPVRMKSSSGGMFSLLADDVLERGGAVCGAAFDDRWKLEQRFAYTPEELEPLRTSKYIQSDTGHTFREAKRLLEEGRPVLYVGCPCQIAGLNSYLSKPYANLLTVDLLCHGGPSPEAFQRYLDEVHGKKNVKHIGFREKERFGWSTEMTVRYDDGTIYEKLRSEDLFYRSFLPCLSVRPHCQVCNYSRLPRQGDITLGDFWGVSRYDESLTDGNGTSIVSLNSEKGKKAYDDVRKRLAVDAPLEREHVLTHGQPYGHPFRNNPLRYRFTRMLHDVSFEKALTCCERNEFDFALVGMNADSYGAILRTYALYKTAARAGHSVLVARRPKECDSKVTPLSYRMVKFANRHYPVVSAHDSIAGYKKINETSHGFFTAEPEQSFPRDFCVYPTGVLEYSKACGPDAADPLLLLSPDDYHSLADEAIVPRSPSIAFSGSLPTDALQELRRACVEGGFEPVSLSDDMDVEEWVARIAHSHAVVTTESDSLFVAAIQGKPLVVLRNGTFEAKVLSAMGVNAFEWDGVSDFADAMAAAKEAGRANSIERTALCMREKLKEELLCYYNETLFRPEPPKRYKTVLRSLRKRAGKVKRAIIGKLH